MPLGELRWVRLDLMPAAPAQNDLLSTTLASRASSTGSDFVGD
jgi:hypothetical protein